MSTDMMYSATREDIISDPVIAPDLGLLAHVRSNSDLSAHAPLALTLPPVATKAPSPPTGATDVTTSQTSPPPQNSNNPRDISDSVSNYSAAASQQMARDALHTDPRDVDASIAALSQQGSVTDAPTTPYRQDDDISATRPGSSSQQYDGTSSVGAESDAHRIQAFAKLEFDDGQFYMNTYAIELGRDSRAEKTSTRQTALERNGAERTRSAGEGNFEAASNSEARKDQILQNGDSIISERGGIMGYDPKPEDAARARKRSRKSSKPSRSSSSSAPLPSVRESADLAQARAAYQAQVAQSQANSTTGSYPVIPASLLPSPDECPLIGIHPPQPVGGITSYKSISRRHARIAFNFDKHIFEVEILGRNGAFVDEVWYPHKEVRPLRSGSIIQIGTVSLKFILPDVAIGETGAHSSDPNGLAYASSQGVDSDDDEDDDQSNDDDEADEDGEEEELALPPPPPPPPVKRGPGRPPKNGIMSKRREKELAKQAADAARANGQILPTSARGRGAPSLLDTSIKPEKRKYTKRKSPTDEDGKDAKDKKPPKAPKPPRSPSPVFDRETLTEEQLAKPAQSYVVLIYEALSNSPTGAMSLPQIYRAIMRKYPYFKVTCETLGWQSSVRHNLSQHDAFHKIVRDGKGWMWGIKEGASIERERRRRASPPRPRAPPPPSLANGFGPLSLDASGTYRSPYAPAPAPSQQQVPQTAHAPLAVQPQNQPRRPSPSAPPRLTHTKPLKPTPPPATKPPAPLIPSRPPSYLTPSTSSSSPTTHSTELMKALSMFKATMLAKFPKTSRSEALVASAIDRALGIRAHSNVTSAGEQDDPLEAACMRGAANIVAKSQGRGSGPSPTTAGSNVVRPPGQVVGGLNGTPGVAVRQQSSGPSEAGGPVTGGKRGRLDVEGESAGGAMREMNGGANERDIKRVKSADPAE